MAFNYSKLIGRIIEIFGSQSNFAEEMELSKRTISLKLNNKLMFKQDEIHKAIKLLNLKHSDIETYFFNLEVQKIEPFATDDQTN